MAEALETEYIEETLDVLFNKASLHLKTLVEKLKPEDLLEFYGYYKQATEGACNIPKPNFYQITAKQKWERWNSLGSMSRENAMLSYIELMKKYDPDWESENSDGSKSGSFGWVTVSRMAAEDDNINEEDKTIFDWVKEGNVQKVCEILGASSSNDIINEKDPDGLGLIHWAADRGNLEMLKCLVCDLGASLNLQDEDGQTPLHFAASCGHSEVVKYLVDIGADPKLIDCEGQLPVDVASNEVVEQYLRACGSKD